jgi:hypothetical protein
VKPWLSYSIIRLALFVVVFTALMFTGIAGWIAGVLAAIISLCIAYIFFRPARDALASSIAEHRARTTNEPELDSDEFAEDNDTRA